MYIDVLRKQQWTKTYKSILIMESYREKGKVKHRTVANITKQPPEHIRTLRNSLKGEKGKFNISDLNNRNVYEYGCAATFLQLAEDIGLDKIISSTKSGWRDDVLAMIVGRILYQGSKLSLVNQYMDTALCELSGHDCEIRPDVEKHCYKPMDELLERKSGIERKLAKNI